METVSRMVDISGDGAPMSIYVAEPKASGKYPVVIVYMEAFGVNGHIQGMANRFAAEGYVAVSPDMYYRAGKLIIAPYNDTAKILPIMRGMWDAQTSADIRMVIQYAKGLEKARADRMGCTGYCMGGLLTWLTACWNRDIKAASCYYSGGVITRETSPRRPLSPHLYAELATGAIMGNYGAEDKSPPPEDVKEVDALLTKLGKAHDFKVYPGAGHGFNCDERPSYHKPSADDAWKRTLGGFEKYLKK